MNSTLKTNVVDLLRPLVDHSLYDGVIFEYLTKFPYTWSISLRGVQYQSDILICYMDDRIHQPSLQFPSQYNKSTNTHHHADDFESYLKKYWKFPCD